MVIGDNFSRLFLDEAWNDDGYTGFTDGNHTNSVISISNGDSDHCNKNGNKHIAYCFHSVTGYSKFGSWTGNGTSTGPKITTNFKPAFIMWKRTDSANDWYMIDITRDTSSEINTALLANNSGQESNYSTNMDILSDGFQPASSAGHINASGGTYIYMAFADKREFAYWLDQSGNNNDWTSNNLTESDISVDSPTNNFATLNPLTKASEISLSEGNLRADSSTGSYEAGVQSTFAPNTGKWYGEAYVLSQSGIYPCLSFATSGDDGSGTK